MKGGRRGERGFTYLALLIALAFGGATLAAAGGLASHAAQREKERELLFIGNQYRQAIAAYYQRSPIDGRRYPEKLEELVEDRRSLVPQRYLRRLYPDPITGSPDWGVVESPEGGIMGVYSRSAAAPIKSGNFSARDQAFTEAARYSDWQFVYAPPPSPAGLRREH
jgi:type II secretory pathway pseudopilin PulG